MDKKRKARRGAGIPGLPEIRGGESTAAIQSKVRAYFSALRAFWKAAGIEVDTVDGDAQLARLVAILRVQGSRGLGSVEGRTAGGMLQLPSRVFDLKARGYEIISSREWAWGADGLRHPNTARYTLLKEPGGANA